MYKDSGCVGPDTETPRGSVYTTIRELGPKIPYYRRNYGPNSLMVIYMYIDPLGLSFCSSHPRGGPHWVLLLWRMHRKSGVSG